MSAQILKAGVIIPAGGSGIRMGGKRKQFRMLGGRPLLVQTALAFVRHPHINSIVVAVPRDAVSEARSMVGDLPQSAGIQVVEGGQTRQDSVWNALQALSPECHAVLVHDAVRPFVAASVIDEVLSSVARFGAAAAAVPVTDTLRRGVDDMFGETVARTGIFRMQTPQGFRREILEAAHRTAKEKRVQATDEVALVQACGYEVQIVAGDEMNRKITTESDWITCAELWSWWESTRHESAGKTS